VIEIALGILGLLGAVAILMGAGDTLGLPLPDLFPLIGFSGTALVAGTGLLLIAFGTYRIALRRRLDGRRQLRSAALAWTAVLAIAIVALVLPLDVALLNVVTLGGFPLGFYLAAQGSLIALVAVAFAAVLKQDAIDAAEPTDKPETGSSEELCSRS